MCWKKESGRSVQYVNRLSMLELIFTEPVLNGSNLVEFRYELILDTSIVQLLSVMGGWLPSSFRSEATLRDTGLRASVRCAEMGAVFSLLTEACLRFWNAIC